MSAAIPAGTVSAANAGGAASGAVAGVTPEPTDEEAAAIVAALQLAVTGPAAGGPLRDPVSRWRFSGRWWSKPVPARRSRPGR